MEIYQLAYFIALARQGSASKAAQQLYVSRQALSKGVHKLEQEIGMPLFASSNNQFEITDFGRQLYAEAEPIVEAFNQFSSRYAGFGERREGSAVKVTAVSGALLTLGNQLIAEFFEANPDLKLSLEVASTDTALDLVRAGDAAVALVGSSSRYLDEFTSICLVRTGSWLNVPRDNPLSAKSTIHIEDLDKQPMVTFGEHDHLHRRFMEACSQKNVRPEITTISDANLVISVAKPKKALFFDFPAGIRGEAREMNDERATGEERVADEDRITLPLELSDDDDEVIGTFIVRRRNVQLPAPAATFWKWLVNALSSSDSPGEGASPLERSIER